MKFFNSERISKFTNEIKEKKNYTLLIVDDELANLRYLTNLLEKDYNILTANDGQQAIDLVKSHPSPDDIHLILTDQRMPQKTGLEFLKETIITIPKTIRIILTGYTDIDVIIDSINGGKVYKFLSKPIDPEDIKITVKRALEAYELERKNDSLLNELKELNTSLELKVVERTKELTVKNKQLEDLNQEKNEFLGIVSHDLKNPLSSILGNVTIVKEFGYLKEDVEEFVSEVEKASSQMLEMIKNLLDINSIEQGIVNLNFQKVKIDEIISELLLRYRVRADIKKITLNYEKSSDNYLSNIDRSITFQIIENILSNALKFSDSEKTILITLDKKENSIIIGIRDEGPGLTEEDKKKLFSKFTRLSAKPTAGENSTGLGLSIVKKLTEAMNGQVWCESEEGKGSCFYVSFPEIIN